MLPTQYVHITQMVCEIVYVGVKVGAKAVVSVDVRAGHLMYAYVVRIWNYGASVCVIIEAMDTRVPIMNQKGKRSLWVRTEFNSN